MSRKTATHSVRAPYGRNTEGIAAPPPPTIDIDIPYLFDPRTYQQPSMAYIDGGGRRAVTVWHRRAGKDQTWLNQVIKQMIRSPFCGTYPYIFPKLTQGRRDLWDAKTSPASGGRPFRAHFPPSLVAESSETEMQITLKPMAHQQPQPISDGKGGVKYVGSVFQVMGTDKESIDNLRGMNCAAAVFSEFSDHDPTAWYTIIEPVLIENGGWAAFDFTPKGKNHAYDIYQYALKDPTWFAQLLTIEQTRRDGPHENGSEVMPVAEIQKLRERGVPEEIIQQEYYCSFEGVLHGTIFGDLLQKARSDGRVTDVPYNPRLPVGTMWDIGKSDPTAIWFYQVTPVGAINFIDYYANTRQGADHYVRVLKERGYIYGLVILPHDAAWFVEGSTGEFLFHSLCRNVKAAPLVSIQLGIDAARRMFTRFYFDRAKCDTRPHPNIPSGLESLGGYRRTWDEKKQEYSKEPVHDQYSHGASALRTGAIGWEENMGFLQEALVIKVDSDFDPRVSV